MQWKKKFGKLKYSLQTKIALLVCIVVIMALFVTDLLINVRISKETQQTQAEKATNIAKVVAHLPIIIEGLSHKRNEEEIQTIANEIRRSTKVEFVVVMDLKGILKSHPNQNEVGKHFSGGDESTVLKGKEHISIAKGTLGMSLRSFIPVYDKQKKQVGAVAVGISLEKVHKAIAQNRKIIYISIIFGVLVGMIGALILARKIKTILLGLEPSEIGKLLEERSAMLQSTKEGIVALDPEGTITLVNNEGKRLFQEAGILESPIGKKIENYLPGSKFSFKAMEFQIDQEYELNGITILVNQAPVIVKENIVGVILTFRDKTEIKLLAEQVTGVKLYAEALRAQSHEFMNKMHVILGLISMENYSVLASYISETAEHQQTEIENVVHCFDNPVLAGFILGKMSFARESGTELMINGEGIVPEPEQPEVIHELITILGNLIDNAIEAMKNSKCRKITLRFDYYDNRLVMEIHDTGNGIDDELKNQIFIKGYTTKGSNRGFGLFLVHRSIKKLHGTIEMHSKMGKGTTFIFSIPYHSKNG